MMTCYDGSDLSSLLDKPPVCRLSLPAMWVAVLSFIYVSRDESVAIDTLVVSVCLQASQSIRLPTTSDFRGLDVACMS